MALKIILRDIPAVCGVLRVIQSARKDVGTAPTSNQGIKNVGLFWPDILPCLVLLEHESGSKVMETWRGIQNGGKVNQKYQDRERSKHRLTTFTEEKKTEQLPSIS
ncbi:hypothetical protein ATANTOWER_024130 [Ataeniobius toweri]|uniref:Uncharacterized protein n=1 Tax=Ataeniobius toweri TaxID=208326 RepID=A0ABU7C9E7_9TELE|nr:hypothetical protein [Ataeniobius toweri]